MNKTENLIYEMTAADTMTVKKGKKPEKKTRKQRKKEEAKKEKVKKVKKAALKKESIKKVSKTKKKAMDTLFKVRKEGKSKKLGRPFGPRNGSQLNVGDNKKSKESEPLCREDLIRAADSIRKLASKSNVLPAHVNTFNAIGRNLKSISNHYDRSDK